MSMSKVSSSVPFLALNVAKPWSLLQEKEKKLAYHLTRASWLGSKITWHQLSKGSSHLFDLIHSLMTSSGGSSTALRKTLSEASTAEDATALLAFFAQTVSNCGNFLSFGDEKFVPGLDHEKAEKMIAAVNTDSAKIWSSLKDDLFSAPKTLGWPEAGGETGYYENCSEADAKRVQDLLDKEKISPLNTRLVRRSDNKYELQIASVTGGEKRVLKGDGFEVELSFGLFKEELSLVIRELKEAAKYASSETEKKMLEQYVEHFDGGDIEVHKASQASWVQLKKPIIETNIGFVEDYRDPLGVRAEWEGLVACVDQEKSKLYETLVNNAESIIYGGSSLPWPKEFERPAFKSPAYISLEVIAFASSGIPIGINLPNFSDVRVSHGFKNVTLNNVIAAREQTTKFHDYVFGQADGDLLAKNHSLAMDCEVALHELLGHGTGHLFTAEDKKNGKMPVDPSTGETATTFYADGETFSSVFGKLSGPIEECRAEAVGLYLSDHEQVAKIFGYEDRIPEICRSVYLSMMTSALKGMAFHNDKAGWGQPHCQARFALMKALMKAGVVEVKPTDGDAKFAVKLSDDFQTKGKAAVGDFLGKLTTLKALAQKEKCCEIFIEMSSVDSEHLKKVRNDIIARRQPRPLYVCPDLSWNGGDVKLVEFEASADGALDAFFAHYDQSSSH